MGTGVVSFVDAKFLICEIPIYISSVYPCFLVYRMNLRIAEKEKNNNPITSETQFLTLFPNTQSFLPSLVTVSPGTFFLVGELRSCSSKYFSILVV